MPPTGSVLIIDREPAIAELLCDLNALLACVSRYVPLDMLPSQFSGPAARSAYPER